MSKNFINTPVPPVCLNSYWRYITMVELDKFEKEIPEDMQEPLMVKMGFDMHSSNKLWRKTIRFGNKDVTLWVDFRGSNKPKYWTQPKIGDVKSLGEIMALEAVMDGTLDAKEWNVSKPITVTNLQGETETISLFPDQPKKPVQPKPQLPVQTEVKSKQDMIAKIKSIVGNDVLEIFGNTGTGKSKLALHIAKVASEQGLKVIYYDTERNLSPSSEEDMGKIDYIYSPVFSELRKFASSVPNADIIIIDSIGFPVLTTFAKMNLKQRGDALLGMIAVLGDLKVWTYKNKSLAIVINQPVSEMGISEGDVRRPFGDKSAFAAKEVWETEIVKGENLSTVTVKSFRSRDMGYGTKIMEVLISNKGVDVRWKV